jgi:O-antigen/teichoic acid export membrane protein
MIEKIRRLLDNPVVRNAGWMLAGQGASLVVQALYFVAIIRLLGRVQYGLLVGASAVVAMVSQYSSLGSGLLFLRYVSPDKTRFPEYWGNILLSTGAFGTILVLGFHGFARMLVPRDAISILLLMAISDCLCAQLTGCCCQVFQTFEKMRLTAALNLLTNLARLVIALVLLLSAKGATAYEWATASLIVSAIVACVSVLTVTWQFGLPRFRPRLMIQCAREGLVFAVSGSTSSMYNDLDKAMLSHYGMNSANGIYTMAYRVVDICTIPIRAVHSAAFPRLFRLGVNGLSATEPYARRMLRKTSVLGASAAVLMFVSAPLTSTLVGRGFAESATAIRWLCLIPLLRSFHLSAGDAMATGGFQNYRLGCQFLAAGGNLALNVILIPRYGWIGAACASLVTDGALALISWSVLLLLKQRREGIIATFPLEKAAA